MTKKDTKLVEAGRNPAANIGAVNVPVYRASTILFPNVAALSDPNHPYTYGRRGTPTTRGLEDAITEIEGGAKTALAPSGLSACALAILSVCAAGDHLLMVDSCYGPTRQFCNRVMKRYGVTTEYFAPHATAAEIAARFKPETKAVFLESPGSFTFEVQDVPAIAAAARAKGIAVILDNTWATPLYFPAIAHGVDLSVQSATKYLGGHADVSVGSVTANDAYADRLLHTHGDLGLAISGDDAFLVARGLRTLSVRLARHQQTALALCRWLEAQPEVERVLYPALPGDPGHALWQRDFTGASGLFGVELKPVPAANVAAMIESLHLFGIGFSWGGFESLILPAQFSRSVQPFPHKGPLIRIHAGLEDPDDLLADLAQGFKRLHITT